MLGLLHLFVDFSKMHCQGSFPPAHLPAAGEDHLFPGSSSTAEQKICKEW